MSLYSMMHHSGKYIIRWSPPFCKVYSSVAYTNLDKNCCYLGKIANTTVPTWSWSIFWPQPPTYENHQWENCYIQFVQWQTTIIFGWTWCEGPGFRRISVMRQLASSHSQETGPRKFNVLAHRVDGEVNQYLNLTPLAPPLT